MTLPLGVLTSTLTFGPYRNVVGVSILQNVTGVIVPVDPTTLQPVQLTHVATGTVLIPEPIPITIGSDATGSVPNLPRQGTGQLSPDNFQYRVSWFSSPAPRPLVFALPADSLPVVDFDNLQRAATAPTVYVPVGEGPPGPQGDPGPKGDPGLADADIAGLITNNASATGTALRAAVPRLPGPLGGWKAKAAVTPETAKVAFVGDSTSDPATGASTMYRRILGLHTQHGEALHGVASVDYFTDGVSTGTTTFTSASANFTAADKGRLMHGKKFPLATVITAVSNSTTVTLSTTVPTGTALPFWVGRAVIGGGNNGMPLDYWMSNPSNAATPYNRDRLVADAPDLTVASWLINDVRTGSLGTTVDAIVAAGITRLQGFVDWHRTTLPNTDLLLRMPNPFLTANVSSYNFVTAGQTVNPAGLAQIYSTALRRIYLSFVGRYSNVDVLDVQGEVFGTRSVASHPLLVDQLHPSTSTTSDNDLLTPLGGGYAAIADAVARRIGFARNAFAPEGVTRTRHEFIVNEGPSAGIVRLISRDPNVPASQAPVFRGDSLYVNGLDGPISLVAPADINRVVSANILQIGSLGTTDFALYVGRTAVVTGTHAPATTGDRQQVFVDLPSVAAGATVTYDLALTGAASGNDGRAAAVIAAPANGFATSGLLMLACYPYSTDTIRLVIQNPSGAAIDRPGESWTFWIVR